MDCQGPPQVENASHASVVDGAAPRSDGQIRLSHLLLDGRRSDVAIGNRADHVWEASWNPSQRDRQFVPARVRSLGPISGKIVFQC